MLIQCQHCHTTYKINEDMIPDKAAFVRCSKCSEPIHLNQEKQSEFSSQSSHKTVECEKCNSRYSVPLETIKRDTTKVRCGKCGHYFSISNPISKKETPSNKHHNGIQNDSDLDSDDFDFGSTPLAEDDIDLDNISIPEESEIEVDNLFNGVDEQEDEDFNVSDEDGVEKRPKNATEEYLESIDISLSDESDEDQDDLGIGRISDDQKYKIFLKPSSKKQSNDNTSDDSWPEIQNDTDSQNLDDEMDQDISEFTGLEELDEMPDYSPEDNKNGSKTQLKNKKRVFLWILWGFIVIAIIVAGWLLIENRSERKLVPHQEELIDNTTKLSILEPLKGRYLNRRNDKTKMFILEGKLKNTYTQQMKIPNVAIEGSLYNQQNEKISSSITYAGNRLTTTQMEQWSKEKVKSFLSMQSNENESILELQPGETVQFQIVFFDVPNAIHKLEAKIKRDNKNEN
ncbi:zinc-ribbon domain-containing protein [bacterium]|nr:zinc-ribbon domain-containing protein [bacterium]